MQIPPTPCAWMRPRVMPWMLGVITLAASASAEEVRISFTPRRSMPAPPVLKSGSGYQSLERLEFWNIGRIETGRHAGSLLALVIAKYSFESKGPGVAHFFERRLRFAVSGNRWTLLERISNLIEYDTDGISDVAETCFTITRAGKTLERDRTVTSAPLASPGTLTPCGGTGLLILEWEMDGVPDRTTLAPVCALDTGATLYVSRPGGLRRDPEAQDMGNCTGAQCYGTNGFFAFRPDGTYLMYVYEIERDLASIAWKDGSPPTPVGQGWKFPVEPNRSLTYSGSPTAYRSRSWTSCDESSFSDCVAVLPSSSVRPADLVEIGKAIPGGGLVYRLRSASHPIMKAAYEDYCASASAYIAQEVAYSSWKKKSVPEFRFPSPDQFLKSRAVLLWRDPFDRWIKLVRQEFIPPAMCEPMIYLYPPEAMEVRVALGRKVRVTAAFPLYREGWTVHASPDGTLIDRESGKRCTRIFWEGSSLLLPEPDTGYVWSRAEVPGRLAEVLAELGLNDLERREFIEAWLNRLTASPWVQVSFREPWEIDLLAPLAVEPAPRTVIRILMDWRPLEQHIRMPEPVFRPPPVREGFVLVEWGGLVR